MSDPPRPGTLHKQLSWSTDTYRDEAWLRKKEYCTRRRRSRSVTDDDLDELKGCIELGFGFCSGSPKLDRKLSDTFPALDFYYAVNRRYSDGVLARTASGSSDVSDSSTEADAGTIPESIFGPGEKPQEVKTKLRQWAQGRVIGKELPSQSTNANRIQGLEITNSQASIVFALLNVFPFDMMNARGSEPEKLDASNGAIYELEPTSFGQ